MEKKVILVCCVVGLLGILSAATGFAAEATRIKASQVQFTSPTQCAFPRSPALALGLTSAVAITIVQVIINAATGCLCCQRNPRTFNSNSTIALACFVFSWFTFVLAFILLFSGAALNDERGEESTYFGSYYCYVVKPGVFAGGSVFALVSTFLGVIYYLTLVKAKNNESLWNDPANPRHGGIAMGQPQFPSPSTNQPVFVHEDTYMRRQFT